MALTPRLWSWSPATSRWIPASEVGCRTRFIEHGCEAAYGRRPPARPGAGVENYPPLLRVTQWERFTLARCKALAKRHRILPV